MKLSLGFLFTAAAGGLAVGQAAGAPPGPPATLPYSCGVKALYALLRSEGFRPRVTGVARTLPAERPDGYSMKELRDAASALGLRLDGVLLEKTGAALDAPMLVFLRRGTHGHYAVVRPVGHTGKLVQVVDGDETPEVMDKTDLLLSDEWTGIALVRHRPVWGVWVAGGVGVALTGLLSVASFKKVKRARPVPV